MFADVPLLGRRFFFARLTSGKEQAHSRYNRKPPNARRYRSELLGAEPYAHFTVPSSHYPNQQAD